MKIISEAMKNVDDLGKVTQKTLQRSKASIIKFCLSLQIFVNYNVYVILEWVHLRSSKWKCAVLMNP